MTYHKWEPGPLLGGGYRWYTCDRCGVSRLAVDDIDRAAHSLDTRDGDYGDCDSSLVRNLLEM